MSERWNILDHTPAPRLVRRRVGASVVMLFAALLGWAVFKYAATGNLAQAKIHEGIQRVSEGIATNDAAQFEAAERDFIDAAGVSIVDPYPACLIHAGRRMREGQRRDDQDAVAAALRRGDFAQARSLAAALPTSTGKSGELWLRLIGELESAR